MAKPQADANKDLKTILAQRRFRAEGILVLNKALHGCPPVAHKLRLSVEAWRIATFMVNSGSTDIALFLRGNKMHEIILMHQSTEVDKQTAKSCYEILRHWYCEIDSCDSKPDDNYANNSFVRFIWKQITEAGFGYEMDPETGSQVYVALFSPPMEYSSQKFAQNVPLIAERKALPIPAKGDLMPTEEEIQKLEESNKGVEGITEEALEQKIDEDAIPMQQETEEGNTHAYEM